MNRLISAIFTLILISCDEERVANETFVVEAFVYAGSSISNINVKSTIPFEEISQPGQPISDATLAISYQNQTIPLSFNPTTQRYDGPEDLIIETGNSMQLEVRVDDATAIGNTIIPEYPKNLSSSASNIVIPPIELSKDLRDVLSALFENARLQITWDNVSENYHFLVIELADTINTEPLFNDDIPSNVGNFFDNFRLVSEPSRDSTYTVIGLSLQNYGLYRAILYRINQEYADLYADQLQDSRNLNEPPSNIQNALGIFTGISSDTILFEIAKF